MFIPTRTYHARCARAFELFVINCSPMCPSVLDSLDLFVLRFAYPSHLPCVSIQYIAQSSRGQDLYGFYQGLALKLAQKLSLARTESIRLSMLKAFNDRQSVLHLEDELERLKV